MIMEKINIGQYGILEKCSTYNIRLVEAWEGGLTTNKTIDTYYRKVTFETEEELLKYIYDSIENPPCDFDGEGGSEITIVSVFIDGEEKELNDVEEAAMFLYKPKTTKFEVTIEEK